jgi:hypothetical protein
VRLGVRREFRAAESSRAMNVSFQPTLPCCGERMLVKEKHQDGSVSRGLRGAGFSAVRTYVQSGLSKPVNEKSASWLWPTCSEFIGIRSNQRRERARSSGQWGTRDNQSSASNDIAMPLPRTLVLIPDDCPRKCGRIVQGEIAC